MHDPRSTSISTQSNELKVESLLLETMKSTIICKRSWILVLKINSFNSSKTTSENVRYSTGCVGNFRSYENYFIREIPNILDCTTGSPITDPGKVDTYYNYNGWNISKAQAIILFHMKVHFVWIDKNIKFFENHGYFVDQSQKQFF